MKAATIRLSWENEGLSEPISAVARPASAGASAAPVEISRPTNIPATCLRYGRSRVRSQRTLRPR